MPNLTFLVSGNYPKQILSKWIMSHKKNKQKKAFLVLDSLCNIHLAPAACYHKLDLQKMQ